MVRDGPLLGLDLCNAALNVGTGPVALVHARNEDRGVGEEIVHLLERTFCGLRKEAVEEDSVREVAYLQYLLVLYLRYQNVRCLRQTPSRTSSQC